MAYALVLAPRLAEASEQSCTELTELEWEAQLKRDLLAKYERRYETDEWQYRAFDGGPRLHRPMIRLVPSLEAIR